ncbi:MAG TPA: hypothetical protein ENI80_10125 [Acidiferrobacteraceae bacterium]|nr:hypothetical protein [Acidiferrobacteraceae bacterium]
MLSTIRDKATGWIAWVVVFLITIPFALWGVGSYFEDQANPSVAEINGDEIDSDVYKQALEKQKQTLRQRAGGKIDPSLFDSPQFRRRALDNIIERRLLLQDAEDQGYQIGDDQINEYIRSSSQFQRDGKFVQELYIRALRNAGYSSSGYEESLRQDNVLQQIINGFTQSTIITKKELERMARLQNQKRKFDYAVISTKSFMDKFNPPPEDIKAAYDSNTSQYRIPEQVQVEYVRLAINDLSKQVKVSKEQVVQAYESADRTVEAEKRRARHILIAVEATGDSATAFADAEVQAKKIIKQLEDGADFAKLAKVHSADTATANKGGDLGFQERGSGALSPTLETAIFALKEGRISKPIRSAFGVHVIKLDKIKKAKKKSFGEMRARLESDMRHKMAEAQFLEQAEQFGDLSYEHPESLQPVVDELGLKVKKSGWFSRSGGKGLAGNPKIIGAAFSEEVLVDKQNSEVIELDSDNLIVLRVVAHRESKLKPFKEVKDSIVARLQSTQARAEISKLGGQFVAKLNSGVSWNEVLRQNKLSAQQSKTLARDDYSFKKQDVLKRVFKMPRPTPKTPVYAGVALGQEGFALIRLKQVVDNTSDELEKGAVANAKAVLQTRGGAEYFSSYQKGLRDRADVIIHEENL